MLIFLYRSTERSTNCACHPCARAMQFFYRIEKKNMPKSFHQYPTFLELCVSALHRSHAKYFKSLTCHQNRGHATLLHQKKTVCTCHPCTKGHAKFLCAKKKNVQPIPCRRKENRHSCAGSPIICGRLFRDIRTFGRAVEGSSVSPLTNTMGGLSGGGRGSDTSGVCSAPSLIISRLRARALALDFGLWHLLSFLSSSGKHTPSKAPVPHDARAQPCVDCILSYSVRQTLYFNRVG